MRTAWPASRSQTSPFSTWERNTCLCAKAFHMGLLSPGYVFSGHLSEMELIREFGISFLRHPLLTTSIMQV